MSMLRTAALAAVLLFAGSARAGDVSMAGGSLAFSTPDGWVGIMETQGDPEVRVFQVPDPSPSAGTTLARVTVTVKDVAGDDDYRQYVSAAMGKARQLTGYQASGAGGEGAQSYTAQENGQQLDYSERYWHKGAHAVQLRCVRPAHSQAGAAWQNAFDRGCEAIAARLQA
jgi:hypothetical protein